MGINILIMKFTSVAVLALFLADTSAILLQKEAKKDCGDVGCDRHLSYDFNQPDLDKAEAHNVAATHHFNGATKAAAAAADAMAAATAKAGAVKEKEATLDASLKAHDDMVAKTLISARKD